MSDGEMVMQINCTGLKKKKRKEKMAKLIDNVDVISATNFTIEISTDT